MSASIKAGVNNDMYLMTDGVTRASIDSAGDVTVLNHLKVGKENIIQTYPTSGYVADFQAASGNQTYISIGTPQDTTLGDNGLVMGVDPSAYRITGRDSKSMRLATNNLDRVVVNPSGYVTKPYQPAFKARGSGSWVNAGTDVWTTVAFASPDYNIGGAYNTSNYRFTAPIDGKYQFAYWIYGRHQGAGDNGYYWSTRYSLNGVGTLEHHLIGYQNDGDYDYTTCGTQHFSLSAGDYVEVLMRGHGVQADYFAANCIFAGYLVG